MFLVVLEPSLFWATPFCSFRPILVTGSIICMSSIVTEQLLSVLRFNFESPSTFIWMSPLPRLLLQYGICCWILSARAQGEPTSFYVMSWLYSYEFARVLIYDLDGLLSMVLTVNRFIIAFGSPLLLTGLYMAMKGSFFFLGAGISEGCAFGVGLFMKRPSSNFLFVERASKEMIGVRML